MMGQREFTAVEISDMLRLGASALILLSIIIAFAS